MDQARLLKQLRAQVTKLHREVYSNAGDAFAHVAVREYFDVDDEDALEYCDVGGGHDKGVDAFWIEDDERRAVLVQTKWTEKPRSFGASAIREAESAYRWLLSIGEGTRSSAAPRVVDAARKLHRVRQVEPDLPVHIHVIVAGSFTKGAHEEQARVVDDLKRDAVEVILVDLDELLEEVGKRSSREGGGEHAKPILKFKLEPDCFFEYRQEPKALVATLDGYELAQAAEQWGYRLYMRNLRFLLPGKARGGVNVGIKHTLESAEGRQRFWYYNNGIAIVCDEYDISKDRTSVEIINMQIVNGAQTTASLHNALELLRRGPAASVLARIITAPDDELQEKITFFNNRQNAVKHRDLQSNDPNQDRLHDEFLRRDPPWFYERKRGEWNALTARDATLKKRLVKRRIDNEQAAQAAFAFYFDPGKARADKKSLFQSKGDGGYYEDIFNEMRTAVSLLVPYRLAKHIAEEKRDYLKKIRMIDPRKANVAERKLLGRQWLKFADQFILGTMAFYVEMRGGFEDDRLEALLVGDFKGMCGGIYPAAIRDLHPLFARKEREEREAREAAEAAMRHRDRDLPLGEQAFSAANYVKGNWDEALSQIQGEWDTREAVGDPLADVPMLRLEDLEEAAGT
jgi:hypothetical protein